MERGTFPDIRDTFEQFVVAKLWQNHAGVEEIQKRLIGDLSLPRYAVVDPRTGKAVRDWGYSQRFTADPSTFADLMREGRQVYLDASGN